LKLAMVFICTALPSIFHWCKKKRRRPDCLHSLRCLCEETADGHQGFISRTLGWQDNVSTSPVTVTRHRFYAKT